MRTQKRLFHLGLALLALLVMACSLFTNVLPRAPARPTPTPTALPPIPVQPGLQNPDEPVFITGDIPYTNPFFLNSTSEPFVMLEDQAGFARRDRDFQFSLPSQAIGAVTIQADQKLTFELPLPAIPQGTQLDVDNDGQSDPGVQVFAVSYWSNTWGGPFLEKRDGTGWSTGYTSIITDPERDDEIKGGTLVVWAPDDEQAFPSGFGPDRKLFTADDPVAAIPAGYNLVDLNAEPFRFSKEARPTLTLIEGEGAVNDYSGQSYADAFEAMFAKASREYPFTQEKKIDWQALHDRYSPQFAKVRDDNDFYLLLKEFISNIPDEHVGLSFNNQVFNQVSGAGYGLVLAELSDGRVIARQVFPRQPAAEAGIQAGAQILEWNGQPVAAAIGSVVPFFGPYSSPHALRLAQVASLTRAPQNTKVNVSYQNPGAAGPQSASLVAVPEFDSLFASIAGFNADPLNLPIESQVLESGVGYMKIYTFSDDYNLMARLWEHAIQKLIDNKIDRLVIDMRENSGGSMGLALQFAGYFFKDRRDLFQTFYFNEESSQFEPENRPDWVEPAPLLYEGDIAVLVSADCVSACEGFAYVMQQDGRSQIVGHTPTAGAFGEVGRGQYKLPGGIDMQVPTGRSVTMDGKLLIEGQGVIPDVTVPVTAESVLSGKDDVLQAALAAFK